MNTHILTVLLVVIFLSSLVGGVYAQSQTISIDNAVQLFESYLTRLGNPNLGLHEVEEYKSNFYATYYEKNTGIFAFQMLIWKPGSIWTGGMIGPNMMWNTKYGVMGGMMGVYRQTLTSNMTVTREHAKAIAQQYLDTTFNGTSAGDVNTFYGYYNVDVLSNGNPFGMLSVNEYTGQVWYHSWHGTYIQTVTVSDVPTPVPEFGQLMPLLIATLLTAAFTVILAQRRRQLARH